jgi:tryptophanyl-tRNA synthetase
MNKKQPRVLSGIQPSGALHLGNYFGMMKRMIEYQKEYELFCFIANYHAMTVNHNQKNLSENTFNAACDFLALGIDPEKSIFWVQSDVAKVAELMWILSNHVSVGLMERSTSYKDKISKGLKPNMGLYSYPILMAADILLFDADLVPVGKDQKQHIEITRDTATRFNKNFGNILKIPEPDIDSGTELLPGIDGRKMSKSYSNTIPIFDSGKKIKKCIMRIVTDNSNIDETKNKNSTLYHLYSMFLDSDGRKNLAEKYDKPGLRYGDLKNELFELVMDYFSPYRSKRNDLITRKDYVYDILREGADKAEVIASEVLARVRQSIGVNYKI